MRVIYLVLLLAGCGGETGGGPPSDGVKPPAGDAGSSETGSPTACTPAKSPVEVKVEPPFASSYRAFTLGAVPGMPPQKYGGINLGRGDAETLLIGGDANLAEGAVYAIKVRRACGHIVGFQGSASKLATAPYIDGSLHYAGDALVFTGYPVNTLGQIAESAKTPTATIQLTPLGVAESVGASLIVPAGFAGAGNLKLVSWPSGDWYDGKLSSTGAGQFQVSAVKSVTTLPGGPEGFAYVPKGSPQISASSLIVSEWTEGAVAVYEIDAAGDPILQKRRAFLTGLRGAEGAFFDPSTGDFLFSTWRDGEPEQVIIVQGFAPIE